MAKESMAKLALEKLEIAKDLAEQTIKKGRFGSFRRSKAMSTGSSQGGGLGASATSVATASRTSDRAWADDEADPNVVNQSI